MGHETQHDGKKARWELHLVKARAHDVSTLHQARNTERGKVLFPQTDGHEITAATTCEPTNAKFGTQYSLYIITRPVHQLLYN